MILAGRYEVVEAIKRGGMGAIYEGRDLRLGGSRCAIKAMLDVFGTGPDAEVIRRKFQSETHILGNLQHAGIPRVRDYFDEAGTAYIVMDFVEGQNLEQEARRQLMDPPTVVKAALEILDVLSYIHTLSPPVIHCDIKPANIIREARTGQLWLVDFGLARSLSGDRKTQTVAGTLGYCPLEQLQGAAEPRSDLYALGATMFELLTGKPAECLMIPSILEVLPDFDGGLAAIVERATQNEATSRYPTADRMRDDLLAWQRGEKPAPAIATASPPHAVGVAPPAIGKAASTAAVLADFWVQALKLTLTSTAAWGFILAAGLLDLACRFNGRLLGGWNLPLRAAELGLALVMAGYLQTCQPHQPLPRWRGGGEAVGRGLVAGAWFAFQILLPCAIFLPTLYVLALTIDRVAGPNLATSGQALVGLGLLLVVLAVRVVFVWVLLRQLAAFPWTWTQLARTQEVAPACDVSTLILGNWRRHARPFLAWFLGLGLWFSVHELLLSFESLLIWPCLAIWDGAAMIALNDVARSVHDQGVTGPIPQWPGAYRAWMARWPALPCPRSAWPVLVLLLGLGGTSLWMGALVPSRDTHLFPFPDHNRLVGFINASGWVKVEPQYQAAWPFRVAEPAVPVRQGEKWGYLTSAGSWLVEPRYSSAGRFSPDGLARVEEDKLWTFLDRLGHPIVPPHFAAVRDFQEGLAPARLDGESKWGFLRPDGQFAIQPQFIDAQEFSGGLAVVSQSPSRYGYVDSTGELKIPCGFVEARAFAEGLAPVQLSPTSRASGGSWGYIDRAGKLAIPAKFADARPFSEGLAAVSEEGKWGFIRPSGEYLVNPGYRAVGDFHEGMAWVQVDHQNGFVDKNGVLAIPEDFDMVDDFCEGLALVTTQTWLGYIDTHGRPVAQIAIPMNKGHAALNWAVDVWTQLSPPRLSMTGR